ncbi:competence protein ComK [Bacillus sp. Marseille-P3661]|uniref:competence protein ComK n=1 Tax=Bacillus sp. Marseille-P3661 TaxID=1936234 RepID=UPI000C85C69A|nr:competence protein ComK [Bacillus sp. Marseille-P3661]
MKEVLGHYEINKNTMALLSVAHIDYSTIVIEVERQLFVRQRPTKIVKAACLDGGASFDGRRVAVTHLTGTKQKVPIPIKPNENIYAFPTVSPTAFDCNWIFFNHIKYIRTLTSQDKTTQSMIVFQDGQHITLHESDYVLRKQMHRTAMCIHCFNPSPQELNRY